MTARRPPARRILLAALAVLLAACSGGGTEPEPTPTTTTPPGATPSQGTGAPTASPSTPAPTATPTSASLPSDHVLVAGPRGVDLVAPDGTSEALTSLPAVAAHDDGSGGVVLQGTQPPQTGAPSPAIMWLPPDGGDAVTVVPDGLADVVTLHDAGPVEGAPTAVFTVRVDAGTPEAATETLQFLALPDGDRERVTVTGGWESGVGDATLADDLIALESFAEAFVFFSAVDLSGRDVEVPANPLGPDGCVGGPGCPEGFTVSYDGGRVAWVERPPDAPVRLVVAPTSGDGEPVTVELDASLLDDLLVGDVRVAGELAVVNRTRTGPASAPVAALRVDLASGEVAELGVVGSAALTRAAD